MMLTRLANCLIGWSGDTFRYPFPMRHVYRVMLAYRFAPSTAGTAPGFNDQRGVLETNRVFRTASPARPAQYALPDPEDDL
jgi:hypothetical protein